MKTFIQDGQAITWSNGTGSAVTSDQPIAAGAMVAIASEDIADGEQGAVVVEGVVEVTKVSGTAWNVGDKIDFDVSAGAFTKNLTPAAGDVTGCAVAVAAAASGDTVGQIKLAPGAGTAN